MMLSEKTAPSSVSVTALTVNDTPSTVTDPFAAMNGASSVGTEMSIFHESPCVVTESTVPIPSTWPVTMWPPNSSPSFSARSRLRRRPAVHWSAGVRDTVSPETSTANQPPAAWLPLLMTVRHTPEQAIDAPRSTVAMS